MAVAILTFLLSYLPLYGWRYAFYNFRPGIALSAKNFVGWKNFTGMIMDKYMVEDIVRVMTNTFAMAGLGILTSPLPMLFAMFLSEIKFNPAKRVIQSLTTLPHFISWVLMYAVAFAMFSVGDGFVNKLIVHFGGAPVNFLGGRGNMWLPMWGYQTWKGLGWSAVVYFAAISGIDQEQYEAARIDGAGRFACMWHITLPGLMPTYIVLMILNIASILSVGFEAFLMFQTPLNRRTIEVLDLFVYNQGLGGGSNYSFATAFGMLKSVVSLVLLFTANMLSKLVREESIF